MKKFLLITGLLVCGFMFSGCTNDSKLEALKQENAALKAQIATGTIDSGTESIETKPNIVTATISRIGGALSRQTSIIGDQVYYHSDGITETLPINGEESAEGLVGFRFNSGGYGLIASCGEGYIMKKCEPFSKTDSVENQDTQCFLSNENPDLMRTSMIIECDKI